MAQKLTSLLCDYFACAQKRQEDVGKPTQRRGGVGSSDEVLENEVRTHAEALLWIERMGHPHQFAEARAGELLQKVISHLHKSSGHGPILALTLLLLRFE